jgi:hypothetical protein
MPKRRAKAFDNCAEIAPEPDSGFSARIVGCRDTAAGPPVARMRR